MVILMARELELILTENSDFKQYTRGRFNRNIIIYTAILTFTLFEGTLILDECFTVDSTSHVCENQVFRKHMWREFLQRSPYQRSPKYKANTFRGLLSTNEDLNEMKGKIVTVVYILVTVGQCENLDRSLKIT
jgi:hypothetical protein